MIREVYINNQLIDIASDNSAGYIFTSPIFRDINKIMSNRTTTYKIPKTTKNLSIFGLADNPDVHSLAPYREHKFLELRDGLPFIDGVCFLLKTAAKELELAVFWGNPEKLQALKDLKLRDLRFKGKDDAEKYKNETEGFGYLRWNEETAFLPASKDINAGFLKIDFGRGVDDLQYIHPCVNVQYILDLIKSSTGITIDYPDEFQKEFGRKWFPLTDKNANDLTWNLNNKYEINNSASRLNHSPGGGWSRIDYNVYGNDITSETHIKGKAGSISGIVDGVLQLDGDGVYVGYEARIFIGEGSTIFDEIIVDVNPDSGKSSIHLDFYTRPFLTNLSSDSNITFKCSIRKKGTSRWWPASGFTPSKHPSFNNFKTVVRFPNVQFGDKFPIIANLPDLPVLDFLKSLMSMYGLFTYHNFKVAPDVVKFVSIDEMYLYRYEKDNEEKLKAYDWTNKLLMLASETRMKLEYTYGDYAQKNKLKYKNDKDVTINADGYIELDNRTLPKEKDLIELPYSPSINTADELSNKFAKIPLYDEEGNYSSVGIRILNQGEGYNIYNEEGLLIDTYKSALFDEKLYFSGNKGLIKKFYSKYQAVLLYPVVVECAVYMSDVELHLFRENNPVYIDGVFYMPITVTVHTNGVAMCKLIKMPYQPKE